MKVPAATVGFSYLIGLIFAFLLGFDPVLSFIISGFIVLSGLGFLIYIKLKVSCVGMCLVIFGTAFGVYAAYRLTAIAPAYALDGQRHEIVGVVLEKTSPAHDMAGYMIESVINEKAVRFSLYASDTGAEVGDSITFEAEFSLLRNNTAFTEATYYMGRGVFLKAAAKTTPVAVKNDTFTLGGLIRGFNTHLKNAVMKAFPNDTGGLICAVFLGDRSSLSDSLSRAVTRAGVGHYTAVSGLHLTLVAHLFISVLGLTRLKAMRKTKFAIIAFLTLVFMVFFNLSPSVTRAGIMLIVYYGGELFMRRGNSLNSIGFAAFILLMFSPYACLDAGLLLSIAGTVGIGVIAPAVNKHFTSSRLKSLREVFIANLCANYAVLPLTAVIFGGVSLVSAITSIILLPFFTLLLLAMVVFAFTAGTGGLSLLAAGFMARIMELLIIFFGRLKFAYIPMDYGFIVPWIITSIIFITVIGFLYKNIGKTIYSVMVSVFALSMMVISMKYFELDKTRFEVYTDGTSACVFLRNNNNSVVIVTDDGRRTADAARNYIQDNFLDEISLLIVLNSTNNSLRLFDELPSLVYNPPNTDELTYDVGGIFTVIKSNGSAVINYNDIKINVAHIKASASADINVTYNYSVNAGESNGMVIHTSRRSKTKNEKEFNAFYERVNLILN